MVRRLSRSRGKSRSLRKMYRAQASTRDRYRAAATDDLLMKIQSLEIENKSLLARNELARKRTVTSHTERVGRAIAAIPSDSVYKVEINETKEYENNLKLRCLDSNILQVFYQHELVYMGPYPMNSHATNRVIFDETLRGLIQSASPTSDTV